ncbi:hypothetical protein CK203_014507 [Vitis vinifera]|uniref:Uncharacterized protein n=1 Tax=Vitis vinifera TaxID=29760 RepID=A0A438K4U1_VITVI|nr:hypothetical protein CK203_014507 [Vitis vinifera]
MVQIKKTELRREQDIRLASQLFTLMDSNKPLSASVPQVVVVASTNSGEKGFPGFGEEELDWLSEHLKKVVELEASREFVTKRKPLVLVVPEGVKGNGWEALRKTISSMQDLSDQVVRALKETMKILRKSYCEDDGYERNGVCNPYFRLQGKGWLELRGLPFHYGTKVQLRYILQKWGKSEDGASSFTVAISVIGEVEGDDLLWFESTRSNDELMLAGVASLRGQRTLRGLRVTTRDNECYNWRTLDRSRSHSSVSNLARKATEGVSWASGGKRYRANKARCLV